MTPSDRIDQQIAELNDWRGELLQRLRILINDAEPTLKEDWKWGTAVWISRKNVCAVGVFKDHVKINFFTGASLPDPHGLFNAGLEAKTSRSIDFLQGDKINKSALSDLIKTAASS